jgi:hypothetical protein
VDCALSKQEPRGDNFDVQISNKTHEATVVIYCAPFGMLNKPEQHDDKVSAVTASSSGD